MTRHEPTKYKNIYKRNDRNSANSKTYYRYHIQHNGKKYFGDYNTIEEAKKALLNCCINNNIPIKNYKKVVK